MSNIVRYHTKVLGAYNATRRILNRQYLFTNARAAVERCNNISLKEYCSKFLLQEKPLKQVNVITRNYASKPSCKHDKIVGSWLLTCGGMVFVAVALGGITRLTESGLSMVTWKLLGEKMPLNETQWLLEFERYKQFPEYKIINHSMTLEEFKRIWWMEYLHRMWGRLIGAVFIIPVTYFWYKGMLRHGMKTRVVALGSLIGLQGLIGWYMVKSGLEDRFIEPSDIPRVSQYRLAAHLGLALLLYTGFLYNALDHLIPAQRITVNLSDTTIANNTLKALKRFKGLIHSTKGLVFLTALSGAFVAGMDAGLIYNTFPKMANKWIPDDILAISPVLKNFTENPTTVQFDHRILGITTIALITCLGILSRKHKLPNRGKKAVTAVLCAAYLQVLLGISTLLYHVPVTLAASHQSGSLILLSTIIWLCHELRYLGKFAK
ncbi:PREDICTED: cytochrome c oxidase assembly protein COX15 homolog [Cyphomyrmex costatus]|uniref:Cytochrome c oxidase assembly protein COX15 like protein n=1 Tax=Cyphomyrmex costatus TaxID=456900 RepID=A0A151ICZ5_9HYME|nr:PREDICTED: cytochrome c oxidase assembly protein COX15 homolog [Cyphomyrmex costatus]KYM98285.1 Cytochrome c oxidase assembly protein COX15 like protein [Cyphomyrmex costatus]